MFQWKQNCRTQEVVEATAGLLWENTQVIVWKPLPHPQWRDITHNTGPAYVRRHFLLCVCCFCLLCFVFDSSYKSAHCVAFVTTRHLNIFFCKGILQLFLHCGFCQYFKSSTSLTSACLIFDDAPETWQSTLSTSINRARVCQGLEKELEFSTDQLSKRFTGGANSRVFTNNSASGCFEHGNFFCAIKSL